MTTALEQVRAQLVATFSYGGGGTPVMPWIGDLVDLIVASIQAGELAPGSVSTTELADAVLAASTAGRLKIASGFFDEATVDDKFAAGAIDGEDVIKIASIGADRFKQGASLAAALAAGLGAGLNVAHGDSSPVTMITANATKDRAVILIAICTETMAGGTTKPSFSFGWDSSHDGILNKTVVASATAGQVFFGAAVLPATKAGICTIVDGTGTAIGGAFAVVLLALPTTP